ncbi:cation-translocating P-type ATPase [Bifidobacterium sp. ESL0745]|uniref:cation-translocating P-type ATPase n=1 Tax=Bifidobacterium sp. ESL0745 TaxID=2983226 RepID=UPI0032AFB071
MFDGDPSLKTADDVAKALDVDLETGLSSQEAERRLEHFGANKLKAAPPVPKWKKFLEQFQDPLVYLLLAATVISVIAWGVEKAMPHPGAEGGEALPFDAIVIVLILIVNAVIGYVQDARAQQAVEALAKMTAPQSTVLRDGQVQRIDTAQLVPGDVLVLSEGDAVGADARLVFSASLRAAEASLTGESVPVAKQAGKLDEAKALGDRTNMVFNGTAITQGAGRAVVTATGMDTQVGKIADMLSASDEGKTPLENEMDNVSKILGLAVCAIAVVVIIALAVMEGFHSAQDVIDSLLLAVSLAVAAVPEGLAAIMTVVLALGVQRMAKHHAIVKKLSSVETLGSASVICSDKTGTLTRNEMTVELVVTPSGEAKITGTGYAPYGEIVGITTNDEEDVEDIDAGDAAATKSMNDVASSERISDTQHAEIEILLLAGVLANDGELNDTKSAAENSGQSDQNDQNRWEAVGDPTEVSLIVAGRKAGLQRRAADFHREMEFPFTSERKMMSVVATDARDGNLSVFAKGAPDVLLGHCTRIVDGADVRPLIKQDRERILNDVERLSSQAFRTLGQAYRPLGTDSLSNIDGFDDGLDDGDLEAQQDAVESDLIWAGTVGIIDPPRTEVRDSVAQAHRAGIRTIMITGDHPLTAARIAEDLGVADSVGSSQSSDMAVSKSAQKAGMNAAIETKAAETTNTGILQHGVAEHKSEVGISNVASNMPKTLSGPQLDELLARDDDGKAFDEAVATTSVFARVAPEHKLKIVKSLQRHDNIVAMTGDGVNDAPAVKAADIGVAMGITGTEVTKESAKMILADDNFSTIVDAVREGRGIFDNIRKFLRYLLSSNMGEVFTVFGGVVLAGFLGITQPGSTGVTVPLLATQLLWINLLTDAAPALAMGVDPSEEDVMGRCPRKPTDRVIDGAMWMDIIVIGITMALVTLIGMDMHLAGGLFTDRSLGGGHTSQMTQARTMGFTILVFAQMINALCSRSHTQSVFKGLFSNKWLWGAIGLSIVLQLVVVYVPFLNVPFGTVPLTPLEWLECIGLSLAVLVVSEVYKFILRFVDAKKARSKK